MSYSLVVSSMAEAQLSALPAELARFIRQQLATISENLTALSRPASILQPRGQLFEAKYENVGVVVWVSIIFRFGQDEQTIHVEHVAVEFG